MSDDAAGAAAGRAGGTLRFVTLNLWGANGPHARRLALVVAELRQLAPDVVAFQEVRQSEGGLPNQAETVARALGYGFVFAPATEWRTAGAPAGSRIETEGLAILSRFPFRQSAALPLPCSKPGEGRIILSAQVAGPAGDLWVHTTHLSYRMNEGVAREEQAQFVEAQVAARARPEAREQPQVVLGDFNAVPDSDEIRFLVGLTTLSGRRVFFQDAWADLHGDEPGYTWLRTNPFRAKMSWLKADRRLDYVFVTPARQDGRGTVRDAQVVLAGPDADGLYPSDHAGVMADVQIFPSEVGDGRAEGPR